MRVLVIGSGGREHTLAWKLSQSPRVTRLFVGPGNGGTGDVAQNVLLAVEDIPALVTGTLPQHRVTKLCPRPFDEDELARLFEDAMVCW